MEEPTTKLLEVADAATGHPKPQAGGLADPSDSCVPLASLLINVP